MASLWLPPRGTASESLRTEDLWIDADGVTLAGRLYLPPGNGPFPAIVFTHGSGPSGRDSPRYQEEATYFAGAGIASLVYDKRGHGASSGDWRTATFHDLAADAVAAVESLAKQQDVDPLRIGLRGTSQSGWILPIAATRSQKIAFLVMISPPGVTPYEQVLYDVRTDVEDAGFTPEQAERAVALTRSGLDYARSWQGWPEHKKRLEAAAQEPWFEIASGPPEPDHWLWKWIHPLIDFDAVPWVERLTLPVLVLLGEQDREAPSQVAGFRLERALRANPRALVRYFPDGDHDLRSTRRPKVDDRAPFASGYLEAISDWVLRQARPET
jgi:hypothetical protein